MKRVGEEALRKSSDLLEEQVRRPWRSFLSTSNAFCVRVRSPDISGLIQHGVLKSSTGSFSLK